MEKWKLVVRLILGVLLLPVLLIGAVVTGGAVLFRRMLCFLIGKPDEKSAWKRGPLR